jgi:hypothetical protein
MEFTQPATDLIQQRTSTRTYQNRPLEKSIRGTLVQTLGSLQAGPLGNPSRFELIDSSQGDGQSLRGLGTYGFIKDAAGFIVGMLRKGEGDLEDFGYQMERAVLVATGLGLGTCWLGGTFTKSRFARVINLGAGETIPAVTALGYIAPKARPFDHGIRQQARAALGKAVLRNLPGRTAFPGSSRTLHQSPGNGTAGALSFEPPTLADRER